MNFPTANPGPLWPREPKEPCEPLSVRSKLPAACAAEEQELLELLYCAHFAYIGQESCEESLPKCKLQLCPEGIAREMIAAPQMRVSGSS